MIIKTKPKVSVIIPLYNQKQFVGQAIESMLRPLKKYIKK